VRMAFKELGIELEFLGKEEKEVAIVKSSSNPAFSIMAGKEVVAVDPRYYRPTEVELLIGDPTKAKEVMGWEPETTLETLVSEMVHSDLELFKRDVYLKDGGHKIMNYNE